MGLLDNLIFGSNANFGGQQGGLLDFLRTTQMQNDQYQPSAGFQPQPQPDQASPLAIGGYQMPRIGSAAQFAPDPAALPMNAQPAQGQMPATDFSAQSRMPPQQTLPTFMGGPQQSAGIGDRLMAGVQNFANAGGPLQALAGGLSGLVSGNRTDPQGMQQQNLRAQYEALVPTLGPQKAMLAVMNPEAAKTLLNEALTNKEKFQKTGVDPLGNEQFGFVNEREQTINGKPFGQTDQTGTGATGPVDHNLKGDAYLQQFPPEVQSQVRDYIAGKTVPTGNPRRNNIIKQIASKYGEDTGVTVDDASFAARKQMRSQLSSASPSSLGGQINIGNTAAGHLADLSEQALKLGNYDTGIAPLSHLVNSARGLGTEQAAKMEALKGAAQHYGQEITKFYAGSPGGVAERDRFIESVSAAKSPKELAAILETEAQLMQSRLNTLGDQIKGVLGPMASEYPVIRPDSQKAFSKIEENVSKLKGGASEPAKTAAPSPPKPGAIQGGYRFKGGNPADKANWEQIS